MKTLQYCVCCGKDKPSSTMEKHICFSCRNKERVIQTKIKLQEKLVLK